MLSMCSQFHRFCCSWSVGRFVCCLFACLQLSIALGIMDVDNIMLPTTIDGLIELLDPHVPIMLSDTPKVNKNLPGYMLIGRGGFEVYSKVSMENKIAIFSRAMLPVTTGLLAESLRHSNVDHVAVSVYSMKEHRRLDNVGDIPLSTDTQVTRFDIGYSHQVDRIPFFALDEHLINNSKGKVRSMCGMLGQGGRSVNYNYISENPQIFQGTDVIVYPSFLHLEKMRV